MNAPQPLAISGAAVYTSMETTSIHIEHVVQTQEPTQESFAEQHGARRRQRGSRRQALRVASQLTKLDDEDPQRVITVRKIAPLGFGAAEILREHFETFGDVEEVLLSGVHSREHAEKLERIRPSGFGFVIMRHAEGAAAALEAGTPQAIGKAQVLVQAFHRRCNDDCSEHAELQ